MPSPTNAPRAETPATGKSFTVDGLTRMRIKDGKISQQGDYDDGLSWQKQLGWIE